MPGLILKLRAHEQILVNGVVIQNGERNARLIVKTPDVNILRLRDAIHPDEVNTPVKRVYYIAQLAVAGEADPEDAAMQLGRGIPQLQDALAGLDGTQHLTIALNELRRRNFYGVLRALRNVLPIEEMLLRRQPVGLAAAAGMDALKSGQSEAADLSAGPGEPDCFADWDRDLDAEQGTKQAG